MDSNPPLPDDVERAERHLRAVRELVDGALQLAQDALRTALRHRAAAAEAEAACLPPPVIPPPTGPDPAAAFCRLSREVCRLHAREARLAAERRDLDRDRMRDGRLERRRTRVRQIMQQALWVDPVGPDRETALQAVDVALEDPEIEQMLQEDALVGDLVVSVCRGCGLLVDPGLLPQEARLTTGPLFPPVHPRPEQLASAHGPDPP